MQDIFNQLNAEAEKEILLQNEPFSTTKRTRRILSSVTDIVHHLFSEVQETHKLSSKTASTHDVNLGRCATAFRSINHTHEQPAASRRVSRASSASSAFGMIAAAAGINQPKTAVAPTLQGRSSSASWEASAAEAELSADLIGLSVSATTLADQVSKFTDGHREPVQTEPPPPAGAAAAAAAAVDSAEWKQQLSPAAAEAATAAEQRETQAIVTTILGQGRIVTKRDDGFLVVELLWQLAGDQHALAYVLPSALLDETTPSTGESLDV